MLRNKLFDFYRAEREAAKQRSLANLKQGHQQHPEGLQIDRRGPGKGKILAARAKAADTNKDYISMADRLRVSLPDMDAAKLWMIHEHRGRRNFNDEQDSYYMGVQYELEKKLQHRPENNGAKVAPLRTRQRIAKQHKVSTKTVERAAKFTRVMDNHRRQRFAPCVVRFAYYILRIVIRTFKDSDTAELAQLGTNRRWRSIEHVALRKLDRLEAALTLNDLREPPGNRLEPLQGRRRGQHSIRINNQFRICFTWKEDGAYDVEIVDYHNGR